MEDLVGDEAVGWWVLDLHVFGIYFVMLSNGLLIGVLELLFHREEGQIKLLDIYFKMKSTVHCRFRISKR